MNHRAFAVFKKEKSNSRYTSESLIKKAFPTVKWSANKHVMVAGERSPFDGDVVYWSARNSKLYDGATAKTLKKQGHTCAACGLRLMPGDKVEIHYLDGNHNNSKSHNLEALHSACHHYTHMSRG